MREATPSEVERIAIEFHTEYETRAPMFGYSTREQSAKPWRDVPEQNRKLMCAVVQDLLDRKVIECPKITQY